MAATLAFAATPALASSGVKVSGWYDSCNGSSSPGCLYYSPNGTGGIYVSNKYISNLSGEEFVYGAGDGLPVRNNAASIGNNTTNCGSTTWVNINAGGDWNWTPSGRGGNLTSPGLRNNEASFDPKASCS
ncbi:hypothetical protein [Actinoallomurus iriomotensis]|uniref:Peptidase inhibitor family I36 n=1 Tax=Actinoallomurus iriomotensis TaxID=478107 RepID=A0A9W6RSA2_9ACTN|nr:hypothetical protein [Actinoallomurus iriomotensis]GLY79257.1 hypothetical protein Airi01_075240 [Actinoallomurus iriomotensis]